MMSFVPFSHCVFAQRTAESTQTSEILLRNFSFFFLLSSFFLLLSPIIISTLAVIMTITIRDIHEAAKRIKPYIHRTPVLTNQSLNQKVGANVFMKCENFQKVGAFKFRGASNAVWSLTDEEAKHGVCT